MAPPKGHPRYGGRKKGTDNKTTEFRELILARVEGPEFFIEGLLKLYRKEEHEEWALQKLIEYTYGKPRERVDVQGIPDIKKALTQLDEPKDKKPADQGA